MARRVKESLHAEWQSLIEISGPFLSTPVLKRVFANGMPPVPTEVVGKLRLAYDEWDDAIGTKDEAEFHGRWVRFVLEELLEMPDTIIREGEAIPNDWSLTVPEHGETLRPDLVLVEPDSPKTPRVFVSILRPDQAPDRPLEGSRWIATPATRMAELLRGVGDGKVQFGIVTNGEDWVLVHAAQGETSSFVTWQAVLWLEERVTLNAFQALVGAKSFFGTAEKDTLEALWKESEKDQFAVTDELGLQVRRAIETLIADLDRIDRERKRQLLKDYPDKELYEAAVTVMMRLVFLLYAEDNRLLPVDESFYAEHYAISTLIDQLWETSDRDGEEILERSQSAWARLLATFRAVYGGVEHEAMRLPPYGGGLFDPDRFPFLEGRKHGTTWREEPAKPLPIHDRTVLHLLESLQYLGIGDAATGGVREARRLSFRSLGVEQIGHVYESLLDHTAIRAESTVLGFTGKHEPEIPLEELEDLREKDEEELLGWVADQTGKSGSAVDKAWLYEIDEEDRDRWMTICDRDEGLYERVTQFYGFVRRDANGDPIVIPKGSLYVTKGSDRRSTGTHYTPPSLTEPIVRHALEPLVYDGPAEGKPESEWKLKSPREILDLKVCDMAMGSGAFLVQACRYLSERLVEAWIALEEANPGKMLVTPEGDLSVGSPGERPIPKEKEERLAVARRYVADRCLHGVDKDPMAVEMAKLSLWLVTLEKNKPFTFLDHSLKCGDSLLGVTSKEQIERFHVHPDSAVQQRILGDLTRNALEVASRKRRKLESFTVNDIRDAEAKHLLALEAEESLKVVRMIADHLIGTALASMREGKSSLDAALASEWLGLTSMLERENSVEQVRPRTEELLGTDPQRSGAIRRCFHWIIEFPDVFVEDAGGFDAFIGNPPFIHGKRISSHLGADYGSFLREHVARQSGSADVVVYFFRRAYECLKPSGALGLIGTNTIAQADSREVGLDAMSRMGASIYTATTDLKWPGSANVVVSTVAIRKGPWEGRRHLNGVAVERIGSFLRSEASAQPELAQLESNEGLAHIGSYPYGTGFFLSKEEVDALVKQDPSAKRVIFRFFGGKELYAFRAEPRYVIDFDGRELNDARRFGVCIDRVKRLVKPARDKQKRKAYRDRWWLFAEHQDALYVALQPFENCFAKTRTSSTWAFVRLPVSESRFDISLVVFATDSFADFAVLQSSIHESWAWRYSPTLKNDLIYSPTDCFRTFPLPKEFEKQRSTAGRALYSFRERLCASEGVGLTALYNKVHDRRDTSAEVEEMRSLQQELDRSVLSAYGWNDLDLEYDFREFRRKERWLLSCKLEEELMERLAERNRLQAGC